MDRSSGDANGFGGDGAVTEHVAMGDRGRELIRAD